MSPPPPTRRPNMQPYGGAEEKTPVLTLVSVAAKVTNLEFELLRFIDAATAHMEAQTQLNKMLIEAIKGPDGDHEKGLQFMVSMHDKTHKLFHYVWRALLVATVLVAASGLAKIAFMVQAARWGSP